ncbi:MAG TPA: response regulator transcription factor [Casimicrobiaceae bacterium]|nr:response regulator transcription factor [Casimicrobiaceae bacterium]
MKLLLIDDHALFREGVALLLGSLDPDVEVLEAASCEAGLEVIENCGGELDIVLMDLQLPGASGLDAIRTLREMYPELPVVAVSSSEDKKTVLEALDAGAMGFVPKSSTSTVLKGALKLIMCKGIYLPPSVFLADMTALPYGMRMSDATHFAGREPVTPDRLGLTSRQADVLFRILQGKSAKVIGRELGLSGSTVKVHTTAVLRALNVTTRTQAIVAAGKIGLRFPELERRATVV